MSQVDLMGSLFIRDDARIEYSPASDAIWLGHLSIMLDDHMTYEDKKRLAGDLLIAASALRNAIKCPYDPCMDKAEHGDWRCRKCEPKDVLKNAIEDARKVSERPDPLDDTVDSVDEWDARVAHAIAEARGAS